MAQLDAAVRAFGRFGVATTDSARNSSLATAASSSARETMPFSAIHFRCRFALSPLASATEAIDTPGRRHSSATWTPSSVLPSAPIKMPSLGAYDRPADGVGMLAADATV